MIELAVIIPSRGRPNVVHELVTTYKTTILQNTVLYFSLDSTDPDVDEYTKNAFMHYGVEVCISDNNSMITALNAGAEMALSIDNPFALMFAGDDHRPRTYGWDAFYLNELKKFGTGMVYGNDLFQGPNIPTQIAMTSDIVKALGYMALPTLKHLYLDNWWLELGRAANCIAYLPDIIVEHMHPAAGKATMDENYARVNSTEIHNHDKQKLAEWRVSLMPEQVRKLKELQECSREGR